jgi:Flp pilus assembly protein TadG
MTFIRNQSTPRRVRRGATLVEAAVVIGTLLVFFFAIFEYGRFIMLKQLVENAAREGARLAVAAHVTDTNSFNYQTTASVQSHVTGKLAGQNAALTAINVQVYLADAAGANIGTWTNAQSGQNVAVQVNANYSPILPTMGLLPATVPIAAKSIMRTEAN